MKKQLEIQTDTEHRCNFCNRVFQREQSLVAHMCEPKRRYQQRSDVGVNIGLQAYIKFYQITQGAGKTRTWEQFETSSFYRAFVKFGQYCQGTRAISVPRFTEWLIKNNKKIDNWCSDRVYTEYLLEYLQIEAVDDALARAVEFGIDWAEKNMAQPNDCLRYGNSNAMCYAVTTGRVSPWVIYNSESGQRFLSSLDAGQVAMIWPYIDSDLWQRQFQTRPQDQAYAQQILTRAGW